MSKIWRENQISELADFIRSPYNTIVLASGYFVIMHRGHIEMLKSAKDFAHKLVCIVNGREATIKKYGFEPVSIEDRLANLAEYKIVDYILEWDHDNITDAIRILCPNVVVNGGDRTEDNSNLEEVKAAIDIGARMVYGVGGRTKLGSSSEILRRIKECG